MIPIESVYLFFFLAGGSIGWITCHCYVGYRYERLIHDDYVRKTGG